MLICFCFILDLFDDKSSTWCLAHTLTNLSIHFNPTPICELNNDCVNIIKFNQLCRRLGGWINYVSWISVISMTGDLNATFLSILLQYLVIFHDKPNVRYVVDLSPIWFVENFYCYTILLINKYQRVGKFSRDNNDFCNILKITNRLKNNY